MEKPALAVFGPRILIFGRAKTFSERFEELVHLVRIKFIDCSRYLCIAITTNNCGREDSVEVWCVRVEVLHLCPFVTHTT